jgi:hypothetical protein
MNTPQEPFPLAPSPATAPVGLVTASKAGRFTTRFALVYGALAVVLIASSAVFVLFVVNPASGWSSWHPSSGTTASVTKQIADHVASEYRSAGGSQLVAVVPSPPAVTVGTRNIAITAVAAHSGPSPNSNVQATLTDHTETYTFCGLEAHCSLSGTPSLVRGLLIRREALETALYTFKYVPKIDSVIAFMPASKASPLVELLYLRKQDLTKQLDRPLDKTLTLATPPRPPTQDTVEGGTIDQLTLHRVFTYTFTDLQSNGALLILSPLF